MEHMRDQSPVATSAVMGYPLQYWLSPSEIASTSYSEYWNDEEIEKRKEWHVVERGFSDMQRHLEETGLIRQLNDCLNASVQLGHAVSGTGADLACGVFWTAPILLNQARIEKLYGVEYSQHRLLKISPNVLQHYRVPAEKIALCLGSFYHLLLPDHCLDFVLLAEAFHHADRPEQLLAEIRRVLKPNGVVLIIGEHIAPHELVLYGRNTVKYVLSRILPSSIQIRLFGRVVRTEKLVPSLRELLKPDPVAGDHYYLRRHYEDMFRLSGFVHHRVLTSGCPFQAFILFPNRGEATARSLGTGTGRMI